MTEEQYEKQYENFTKQGKLGEEASKKFELMLKEKCVIYHKNTGFLKQLAVGELTDNVTLYSVYLQPDNNPKPYTKPLQIYIFLSGQDSLSKTPICPDGYMKAYIGDVVRGTSSSIDRRALYVSYASKEKKYLVKPMTFLRSYSRAYVDKVAKESKLKTDSFKRGLVWMRLNIKNIRNKEVLFRGHPLQFKQYDAEEVSIYYLISGTIRIDIEKNFLVNEEQFLGLFDLTHYDKFWKLKMKVKLKELETLFGEENFYYV